jgi:hypothetical protein
LPLPLQIYITPFAERGVAESAKWDWETARAAMDVVNKIWLARR